MQRNHRHWRQNYDLSKGLVVWGFWLTWRHFWPAMGDWARMYNRLQPGDLLKICVWELWKHICESECCRFVSHCLHSVYVASWTKQKWIMTSQANLFLLFIVKEWTSTGHQGDQIWEKRKKTSIAQVINMNTSYRNIFTFSVFTGQLGPLFGFPLKFKGLENFVVFSLCKHSG